MYLDQYYTTPSVIQWAYEILKPRLSSVKTKLAVDITAGRNEFLPLFPKSWDTFACDLDPPKETQVQKADFRDIVAKDLKELRGGVFGFNPPFGPKCQLGIEVALHGIQIQSPEIIILILTCAGSRRKLSGYILVDRIVVPKDAFIMNHQKYHCPSYLCIFTPSNANSNIPDELIKQMTPFRRSYIRAIYNPQKHFTNSPLLWVVRRSGNNCGCHGYIRENNLWYAYRFGILEWMSIPAPDLSGQWVAADLQQWLPCTKSQLESICLTLYHSQRQRKKDGLRYMSLGMEQVDVAVNSTFGEVHYQSIVNSIKNLDI